jgi:autophagy-related protein 9
LSVFISVFTVGFILFLYNCIDYEGVFDVREDNRNLSEFINWGDMFKLPALMWALLITYFIYIACKMAGIVDHVFMYQKIHDYYTNVLEIPDWRIKTMKWEEIVGILHLKYRNENLNVYNIANRITNGDNYMIALVDHNILNYPVLTNLMEWNFTYCFIHSIFDDESKINIVHLNNLEKTKGDIGRRIIAVSVINFLFMPFILLFILFSNFFEYGATFYNSPSKIASYNWTRYGKWQIRNYNELYHNFHERLKNSEKPCIEYTQQFPNKLLDSILGFFVFTFSSFFIVLLVLSFINDNILTNLFIGNKSILWILTIMGSLVTVCHNMISHKVLYYPSEKMEKINNVINFIPEEWIDNAHTYETRKKFFKLFEYKILTICKNIIYTILVPFQLAILYYRREEILLFIKNNTKKHALMGYTCKFSIFECEDNTDTKTILSFDNFKEVHQEWCRSNTFD